MKAEYINPFLNAAKNVIQTMARVDVKGGKPQLKVGNTTFGKVSGIIGMASANIAGNMVISFQENCILNIVANMLMEEPKTSIDNDVVDAVGELTNMICGGAKAELSKLGHTFDLATPTMIVGENIEITNYSDAPTIVIALSTEHGDFVLEANFSEHS
ncbi:MAG: chemotaxis protein CheX [Desulfobulbaceae bacterium]|nr:chemotaxis protein CheX [Desulfobulbaceae bacterium]